MDCDHGKTEPPAIMLSLVIASYTAINYTIDILWRLLLQRMYCTIFKNYFVYVLMINLTRLAYIVQPAHAYIEFVISL